MFVPRTRFRAAGLGAIDAAHHLMAADDPLAVQHVAALHVGQFDVRNLRRFVVNTGTRLFFRTSMLTTASLHLLKAICSTAHPEERTRSLEPRCFLRHSSAALAARPSRRAWRRACQLIRIQLGKASQTTLSMYFSCTHRRQATPSFAPPHAHTPGRPCTGRLKRPIFSPQNGQIRNRGTDLGASLVPVFQGRIVCAARRSFCPRWPREVADIIGSARRSGRSSPSYG